MANQPQYTERPSLQDVIETFRAAMFDAGIEYHGEITPSLPGSPPQRFRPEHAKHGESGWYKLYYDDRPAGVFGDFRTTGEEGIQWQMDGNFAPLSAEEKAAFKAACAERDALREKERIEREEKKSKIAASIWDQAGEDVPADHDYLVAKQVKSYGLRVGPWSVWVHPTGNEEKGHWEKLTDTALLMPLVDVFNPKKIWSIQAIVPPSAVAADKTNKLFLPGGAKIGRYFMIGKPKIINDRAVFILCEGYATGASIHEATGHAVIVTFDASNLVNVAKALHEKTKKSGKNPRFLIAGDDDRFTVIKGMPSNTGRKKGNEAANILSCPQIYPVFADLEGNPTDFNDLHCREGLDVVAAQFEEHFNPAPPQPDPVWDDEAEDEQADAVITPTGSNIWDKALMQEAMEEQGALSHAVHKDNSYFRVLGYKGKRFYFYVNNLKQVVDLAAEKMGSAAYINILAPLHYWAEAFPPVTKSQEFNTEGARDRLTALGAAIGPYDESVLRGRGAWREGDSIVLHIGREALVDGQPRALRFIEGNHVYEIGTPIFKPMTPFTAQQGRELMALTQRFPFKRAILPYLCLGWYFVAPLSGILRWRPHIWITGEAGSGKTTISKFFTVNLLGNMAKYFLGNSSEAGIRQAVQSCAMPVVIDEFESNDPKEKARIDSIKALSRQASADTGATVARGSASGTEQTFAIPSCFAYVSVNTNITQKADADRITVIDLFPADENDPEAKACWYETAELMTKMGEDESLADRWLSRCAVLAKPLLETIKIFCRVGIKIFGSARNADQYGTLMAGAYMAMNDEVPTDEQATEFLMMHDWSDTKPENDEKDAEQALQFLLGLPVKTGDMITRSIGDLVLDCYARDHGAKNYIIDTLGKTESRTLLAVYGIKYDMQTHTVQFFSDPTPQMKSVIKDTSFSTNLRGQLLRIPDAKQERVNMGVMGRKRGVWVPVKSCLPEAEIPLTQTDLPL